MGAIDLQEPISQDALATQLEKRAQYERRASDQKEKHPADLCGLDGA